MKIVALLPMKGNSERVPNKNLKNFCGKPLYHAILNTLIESKFITQIVVNTDSLPIKTDIINSYGNKVRILDRPKEIQGDFVSMNKIIEHDISKVNADLFIQTHSTNPLLKSKTIDLAIEQMIKHGENIDSVFSVTKLQTRLYDGDGNPYNHDPGQLIRTQDLPPLYEENSNFYIFSKKSFVTAGNNRIGLKPLMFEISKLEAIDIDEPEDFILAETLYEKFRINL